MSSSVPRRSAAASSSSTKNNNNKQDLINSLMPASFEDERMYMVRSHSFRASSFLDDDDNDDAHSHGGRTAASMTADDEEEEEEDATATDEDLLLLKRPDECLLCLEDFTSHDPPASSLCKCGMNRNLFHLNCLLLWRSSTMSGRVQCPLCDEELFFDDSRCGSNASAED